MTKHWSLEYLRHKVLEEIVPLEGRQLMQQGGLYVHSLENYFGPEVILPDYRNLSAHNGADVLLFLLQSIKRDAWEAGALCFPHFDTDLGFITSKFWPDEAELQSLISRLFAFLGQAPQYDVTLNLGDDTTPEGRRLTRAVLRTLGAGQTYLEPKVVFRVRKGINLEPRDPNHDLLLRALNLARERKGIAFSLMDSPLNAPWLNMVAYNVHGLRVEPSQCDLYVGSRGDNVLGQISLNIPLLQAHGTKHLLYALGVAARLLAHRSEINGGVVSATAQPLIVNLVGLATVEAVFEILEVLYAKTTELCYAYERRFLLAATGEDIPFTYGQAKATAVKHPPVLVASLQHLLPGGHCYEMQAGPHKSVEELYRQLEKAAQAGVSFVRYLVDDTRCATCALPIAALGPCPACGCEYRRTVDYNTTRLEECTRHAEGVKS